MLFHHTQGPKSPAGIIHNVCDSNNGYWMRTNNAPQPNWGSTQMEWTLWGNTHRSTTRPWLRTLSPIFPWTQEQQRVKTELFRHQKATKPENFDVQNHRFFCGSFLKLHFLSKPLASTMSLSDTSGMCSRTPPKTPP